MEDDFQDSDESLADSDIELQEAFARGDLEPGLVVLEKQSQSKADKPVGINKVDRLKVLLKEIQLPQEFSWAEKLDVISGLAPLAPEIAVQLDEHREKREKEIQMANSRKKKKGINFRTIKTIEEDPVHNDFQRELNFHRQAQSAIMTCLPKLKSLGIPTKRPNDFFAEMAKSDTHMQKVASVLLKKQTAAEKAEKVRKVRDQKKVAKQTQVQVLQERQKAKKELIDNVKKYRKGQKNSLDFLEERKSGGGRGGGSRKRELKNERYGYGGKKSGSKRNTKDSLDNVAFRGRGRGGGNMGRGRIGNRRVPSSDRSGSSGRGRGGSSARGRGGGSTRGRGGSSARGRGGSSARGGNMNRSAHHGGSSGRMGRGGGGNNKRPGKNNRIKAKARSNS